MNEYLYKECFETLEEHFSEFQFEELETESLSEYLTRQAD